MDDFVDYHGVALFGFSGL